MSDKTYSFFQYCGSQFPHVVIPRQNDTCCKPNKAQGAPEGYYPHLINNSAQSHFDKTDEPETSKIKFRGMVGSEVFIANNTDIRYTINGRFQDPVFVIASQSGSIFLDQSGGQYSFTVTNTGTYTFVALKKEH